MPCFRRLRLGQALVVKTQSGRELERIESIASRLREEVERLAERAAVVKSKRDPLPGPSLGGGPGPSGALGRVPGSGSRAVSTAGGGSGSRKRLARGQVSAEGRLNPFEAHVDQDTGGGIPPFSMLGLGHSHNNKTSLGELFGAVRLTIPLRLHIEKNGPPRKLKATKERGRSLARVTPRDCTKKIPQK